MKKINLNSAAFLVLGVFLLLTPALSQAIITSLVTAFFRDIDLLLWVNLAQNFWILNLIPKVVGATLVAGFAWKHLKTRFKVDLPKIKVQTTRLATYSLLFMLCAGLFLFADVPISEAATTATTGYILDIPYSSYDWLVGQYSDGNYYAINGSNWDNMVGGVGSTAWSAYTGNSTALVEQVLAACTSGHILLKDVEFDYDLTIPENVTVTERNNGLDRTFINSANSQGSPYTISVDTVQSSYYMAQDSMGRFIDEFTSTNAADLTQDVIDSIDGGTLYIKGANYTWTQTVTLKSGVYIEGELPVYNHWEDIAADGKSVYSSGTILIVSGTTYAFNGSACNSIKIENIGVKNGALISIGADGVVGGQNIDIINCVGYNSTTYFMNLVNCLHVYGESIWVSSGQLLRVFSSGAINWNFGNMEFMGIGCSLPYGVNYGILLEENRTTAVSTNLITFYRPQVNGVSYSNSAGIMMRCNGTSAMLTRINVYDADIETITNPIKIAGYVRYIDISSSMYPDSAQIMLIKSVAAKTPTDIFLDGRYTFNYTQPFDYYSPKISIFAEDETTITAYAQEGSSYRSRAYMDTPGTNYLTSDNKASNAFNISAITDSVYGSLANPFTKPSRFLYVDNGQTLNAGSNIFTVYSKCLRVTGDCIIVSPVSGFEQAMFTVSARCTAYNTTSLIATVQINVIANQTVTLGSDLIFLVVDFPQLTPP